MHTHKLCFEKGDEHDTTARANKAHRAQERGGAERAVPTAAESVARFFVFVAAHHEIWI